MQIPDQGWTSPWLWAGGDSDDRSRVVTQPDVTAEGDLALVTTGTAAIERCFPAVSSGILTLGMCVRVENPDIGLTHHRTVLEIPDPRLKALLEEHYTLGLNHPRDSVLKVYAMDREGQLALRWHYPYAWPEVGGNTYPRFYVLDAKGEKRKGLEATDFRVESDTWYEVAAALDLDARTWEFRVDDVKFDYPAKCGREMALKQTGELSTLRLTAVQGGRNWIDSITIRHDGKLLASTGFSRDDGYAANETVIDRPGKK